MSKMRTLMAVMVTVVLLSGLAMAAGKTYQVTGPVLEVTADKIVVKKGEDKWEILRDANTKVNGDLVVGAKVTITYTMTASSVEVKPASTKSSSSSKSKPKS
jgi:uncharacterized beta-barrel protein YwiB (DUF1934 family)